MGNCAVSTLCVARVSTLIMLVTFSFLILTQCTAVLSGQSERNLLSLQYGSISTFTVGAGTGLNDPSTYIDAGWSLVAFEVGPGFRFALNGGTLLNNTLVYPPGSSAAFSPTTLSLIYGGTIVLRDAFIETLCSAITRYIRYYNDGGPGAGAANITVLDPHSFYVGYYDFNSTTGSRVTVTNMTYSCNPSLDESSVYGSNLAGASLPLCAAALHEASLVQHSCNIRIAGSVTMTTGPNDDNYYIPDEFNGATWPVEGLRFASGNYRIESSTIDAYIPAYGAFDGSATPNIFTVAPGANLSLSNTYLYGMCAQATPLPPTFTSFAKNAANATVIDSNKVVLPLAATLWPIQLEASGLPNNGSDSQLAQLYVNASTILVSDGEASTLHYLAALQPHLFALGAAGAQAAVAAPAVAQLAQLVLGASAAAAYQASASSAAAAQLSQLGASWALPANLSAQPVFAAYSLEPGAVRVSWSPTPSGAAMRDTTIGALEPDPDMPLDVARSPSWLPYERSTGTYYPPQHRFLTLGYCDTGLPWDSSPLFSPPLLTVGGLSPTTPTSTKEMMEVSSNYVAVNLAAALASAATWAERITAAAITNAQSNQSTPAYLPPVILLFANSTLLDTNTTADTTAGASPTTTTSLEVHGAIVMAGPVPPPPGLPTTDNPQLVPDFPIASARPTLDLFGAVDAVRIMPPSPSPSPSPSPTARWTNGTANSSITAIGGRRHLQQEPATTTTADASSTSSTNSASGALTIPLLWLQRLQLANLSLQPIASNSVPVALPLWAFDRPARDASDNNVASNDSSVAGLVLTSVTIELPATEFLALCALARLAFATPSEQPLRAALNALREAYHVGSFNINGNTTTAPSAANATTSSSIVHSAEDAFLAALSHPALNGITAMGSSAVINIPAPTSTSMLDNIDNTSTTASQQQSLHLESYSGWGSVGADMLFVPDVPSTSLDLILAADVQALMAAMMSRPPPPNNGSSGVDTTGPLGGTSNPSLHNGEDDDTGGSNHKLSLGGAVGVAIAAAFLVALAVVAAVWMLRRIRSPSGSKPGSDAFQQVMKIRPSLSSSDGAPTSCATTAVTSSAVATIIMDRDPRQATNSNDDDTRPGLGRSQQKGMDLAVEVGARGGPHSEIHSLVQNLKQRGRRALAAAAGRDVEEILKHAAGDALVLTRVLGRGGMGTVYEGSWQGLTVAIKAFIVPDDGGVDDDGRCFNPRSRAVTEAAVCCSLSHPNVVTTYHYEVSPVVATAPNIMMTTTAHGQQGSAGAAPEAHDWKLYLVQELCDTSLSDLLQSRTLHLNADAPVLPVILPLLRDVAAGMVYLHARNIIHGDLKPENVLLKLDSDEEVSAKVTDFGLSVALDPTCTHISNCHAGTPYYIAPEVAIEGCMTKAADVYSYGVLAWEMFLAIPPYLRTDAGELIFNKEFWHESPSKVAPDEMPFRDLCARCMSHDPRSRPTFEEVSAELQRMEDGKQ